MHAAMLEVYLMWTWVEWRKS